MLLLLVAMTSFAQTELRTLQTKNVNNNGVDSIRLKLEQQGYTLDTILIDKNPIILDKHVVTNPFWHNIFFTGSVGAHTFRGDFASYGNFGHTIDMNWFVGLGKWFTPSWGIKVEGGMGRSSGFMDSKYDTPYTYGDLLTNSDGNSYYKTRTKWYDISVSGLFNITRSILGYEGPTDTKRRNQFIASVGIGYVGHYGVPASYFVADEFGAHVELQYSRFLNAKKTLSFDAKVRGLLYQTNFDRHDHHKGSHWIDSNIGIAVGMTYHLKHNTWGYKTNTEYKTNYLTKHVVDTIRHDNVRSPEYGQLTFYVFYPNNYSGRNDAPIISGAKVNAIDYLAGGLYTQKQYKDNAQVANRLNAGKSPIGLDYVDLSTQKANDDALLDGMPRGYEICTTPMSLSLANDSIASFKQKFGFYYSPIWDGKHSWMYRIDDVAKGQMLIDRANYGETVSYGLNSKLGVDYVRKNFADDAKHDLYSFADIYAALEGNGGYIAKYADQKNVEKLLQIFTEATVTNISVTGMATSQDDNPNEQIRLSRNSALAQNRANTVINWLKGCSIAKLADVQTQVYMVNTLGGQIRHVKDSSTRGLDAKINRCVKVTIHYIKL